MTTPVPSPRERGFRMPAEWEPHARTWMAWPCRAELWGDRLEAARAATAELAEAISAFEPVTVIARPELAMSVSLACGPGVGVLPMPQDDSWARDTGPSFLIDDRGGVAGVAWRFNGWGEAYAGYAQDARMARRLLEHLGLPCFEAGLVLEGGGVHVDGEGTALLCAPSVLDPKRNPGVTAAEVEAALRDLVGAERVIWLPDGLADDETGGHVDNVACFARPGAVLLHLPDDRGDPDHDGSRRNLEALRAATDAKGRPLEVVPLPAPKARARGDGRRLTLSYVNFYLANGGAVVPGFGDPADAAALKAVAQAFPDRRAVQVDALDLLHGGGGIHCVTQQQPEAHALPTTAD